MSLSPDERITWWANSFHRRHELGAIFWVHERIGSQFFLSQFAAQIGLMLKGFAAFHSWLAATELYRLGTWETLRFSFLMTHFMLDWDFCRWFWIQRSCFLGVFLKKRDRQSQAKNHAAIFLRGTPVSSFFYSGTWLRWTFSLALLSQWERSYECRIYKIGDVAELADALDLGSCAFGRAGSIPVIPTNCHTRTQFDFDLSPFFCNFA